MKHIWLALDPETLRVMAQDHEWRDGDFPRGPRGANWPRAELDVSEEDWSSLLSGAFNPQMQDEIHIKWWTEANSGDHFAHR